MPTKDEVIKELESKTCNVHNMPPCLGNISTIIPVLTCCQDFKEQLQQELIRKFGKEFVNQTIRLTQRITAYSLCGDKLN